MHHGRSIENEQMEETVFEKNEKSAPLGTKSYQGFTSQSYGGLKSQDEILLRFCVCVEKRPLTVKFSKFCSESFCRDTDRRVVFKFCEIWPTKNR